MIKIELRKAIAVKAGGLTDDYKEKASNLIIEKIEAIHKFKDASVIFTFVGTEDEVNTKPLIENALMAGKTVGVPLCTGKGMMEVKRIASLDDLIKGKFDIEEPKDGCETIDKQRIDYGIIPCVTCNKRGERLGHGGGYYDRYLRNQSFSKVMICFDELITERIPTEEHDLIMDVVITEKGMFVC